MCGFLARIVVTHAYICLSMRSTAPHGPASQPMECSPTAPAHAGTRGFGGTLDARLLSTHGRSTSELLRTL